MRNKILNAISDNDMTGCWCKDILQTGLRHLLLSGDAVPANGLYAFRIENGLRVVRVLELEPNVAFLRHQDAGQVDLCSSKTAILDRTPIVHGHTFSNLSLTGAGFIFVMESAMSWPILKACSLVLPGR